MAQRKAEKVYNFPFWSAQAQDVLAKMEANEGSTTGICEDCNDDQEREVWVIARYTVLCREHAHEWANEPSKTNPEYLAEQFFLAYKERQ